MDTMSVTLKKTYPRYNAKITRIPLSARPPFKYKYSLSCYVKLLDMFGSHICLTKVDVGTNFNCYRSLLSLPYPMVHSHCPRQHLFGRKCIPNSVDLTDGVITLAVSRTGTGTGTGSDIMQKPSHWLCLDQHWTPESHWDIETHHLKEF